MKLSIIVPIYNVEDYISRCALSLYNQTASKDDYEVVFVNDGTKDNSIRVLRDVIDFNATPNFHIVEKDNGGLSSARNYGIKHSSGEYTWFVDSDDWVDEDSVERIIPLLNGIDALHFPSYYKEDVLGSRIRSIKSEGHNGCLLTMGSYQYPAQLTIYRYDYLKKNNLKFHEGILMEDLHFSPRALYFASKLSISTFPVYHYFQRGDGIMKSKVSAKRIMDRIWISHDLYKFSNEHVSKDFRCRWRECVVVDVNAIMYDACRSKNREIMEIAKSYINNNKCLTDCLKYSRNKNNRLWYYLSKVCLNNFYFIYCLLYKIKYS